MSESQHESCSWINRDYLELILSKLAPNGRAELSDYKISAGSVQGENFAGIIYRVTVDYTSDDSCVKSASLIIKSSPVAGAMAELLETLNVFKGESYIYQKVLSHGTDLLPDFKIAPRLIYADDKAMVLEDLSTLDFELADRKNRFDLTHAKLVVAKLAKFHALTATMYQRDQAVMENHMTSPHDSEEMTSLSFFFSASFQESLETIRNTNGLEAFVQPLESFDILKEEKLMYSRNSTDKFHALNHGDLWINNIFFKYDGNKEPIDTLLVDYQESYFGSPGIDFNHFLYTSCNFDVHANHFDDLTNCYYDNLSSTLRQLKHENVPSLDDIRYEINSKAKQGLIALLSVVPVQMIENPEHANPEYFLADTEEAQLIRREVYGNPKYVEVLKVLLPIISNRGIFSTTKSHI